MNPLVITQKLLDHYQSIVRRENQVHQERLQLRAHIIRLVRAGAAVQQGRLHYRLEQIESKSLTKDKVLAALGWEAYDDLMAAITPVVSDRLTIVEVDVDALAGRPHATPENPGG